MAIKRLNYFKGEFLIEEDFEEEQNYHVNRLREHNENLHNGGIAAGLEVPEKFEDETSVIGGADLLIKKGMAIDDSGRQIELTDNKRITASTIIPAGSTNTVFYLIIYYHEEPTDPREDNPGKPEKTRITEEPVITFVENLEANDQKKPLILAEVTLDSDKNINKIDISGRRYASSRIADESITTIHIADKSITSKKIADESITSINIDSEAVKREHLNSDIFNNILSSPDGTIGIEADIPNKQIKLISQVATGVVEFSGFTPSVQNVSGVIDPGFGSGPISVILGLDETNTSNNQVFIGTPEASGLFNLPDVLIGALVDASTGKFRVGMSVRGAATAPIRVRWWASKPGQDKSTQVVVSVSIDPLSSTLWPRRTQQFTAIVSGTDNTTVTWRVEESNGGSIDPTGLYTAPETPGTYHIVATSNADATKTGMVVVTVTEDISVSIAPATASVFVDHQQQFTASVTGSASIGVIWKVIETNGGTIDTNGLYTAPDTPGTYTVVAASKADNTKTSTAQVEVKPEVAVTISPADVYLFTGQQQQFRATVTGSADTGVIWSVQEGHLGGTIDGTGLYTSPSGIIVPTLSPIRPTILDSIRIEPILAPITPVPSSTPIPVEPSVPAPGVIGTYHVVAKSKADPTKMAVANVTVTMVSVSISPVQVTMIAGKTLQFTSTVRGVPNTGVLWTVFEGQAGGEITSEGLYAAPGTPGTYHVVATSVEDQSKKAMATVTVTSVSISVSPALVTLLAGGTQQFNSIVTGTTNTGVSWSTTGGVINAAGLYMAPATPGTYKVIATSAADPGKTVSATVTVTSVLVSVTPSSVNIEAGKGQEFNASVSGTPNTGVTWSVKELGGGAITDAPIQMGTKMMTVGEKWNFGAGWILTANSIDARAVPRQVWLTLSKDGKDMDDRVLTVGETYKYFNIISANIGQIFAGATNDMVALNGVSINVTNDAKYTAPSTPGTYHVIATSAADSTKTATATVTVTPSIAVSVNPSSSIINVNKELQFKATVTGTTNTAVIWRVNGGNINTAGMYTAPGTPGTYQVIATSVADNTKFATATVTVKPALSISINPVSATVNVNQGLQFGAVITGNTTTAGATWSAQGGGSINSTGMYTAPGTPGTYHVVVTSVEDNTKTAMATVIVVTPISVSIQPVIAGVEVNESQNFSAIVTGTTNKTVTWKVQESGGGTINNTGMYTAPGTPGSYHVIAMSVADPTKSATATVKVTRIVKAVIEDKLAKEFDKIKDDDKLAKEFDKIAEKLAKEGDTVPIIDPGPINDGVITFDDISGGRAFIRAKERPDVGNITSPK